MSDAFDLEAWAADLATYTRLSRREASVWVRLFCGETVEEIAESAGLSPGTVRVHRQRALDVVNEAYLTLMLAYGPGEFHANTADYPEHKAWMEDALALDGEGGSEITARATFESRGP